MRCRRFHSEHTQKSSEGSWLSIAAFTPSTLPYLVPALRAPALMTPGHLVQIAFTPEYFSLRED